MIFKDGFIFSFDESGCSICGGECCCGKSGYVWVSTIEIKNIANFLGLTFKECKERYTKKVGYKVSLIEKEIGDDNYACVFFNLETKKCDIYDVRPKQCREFPFWESVKNDFEAIKKECKFIFKLE